MFYDRPKKKIKRPPEIISGESPKESKTEETKAKNDPKRFSLFRFFFLTPVHENRPIREEEGYKEAPREYAGKKGHPLLKFTALLLVLLLILGGGLYVLPAGVFGKHDAAQFLADNELPGGYVHILLIGADVDENGTSRSDTMMIASVAPGKFKLTSLQRDTGVIIPGREGYHRLNAAYAYGGAELLLKTVNSNFGLNITRYALVDYDSFPALIDRLGGITLAVSEAEIPHINKNLRSLLNAEVKSGKRPYEEAKLLYYGSEMAENAYGDMVHLDGLQALSYARIRKLDSDYGRTSRQRKVVAAALSSVKDNLLNPFVLVPFASDALNSVETNMNTMEIMSVAFKAISAGVPEQTRLPISGTYTDNGGMFEKVDYKANTEYFIQFVYGG